MTPRFCSAGAQAVGIHYVGKLALVQMPNKYSLFPFVQLKYRDFSSGTFSRNNNKKERKTKMEKSKLGVPEYSLMEMSGSELT